MGKIFGVQLSLVDEREVQLVGRKGAIGLAVIKVATCAYAADLALKATPGGSLATYLTSLVTLSGLFFVGNAAEHFAKKPAEEKKEAA